MSDIRAKVHIDHSPILPISSNSRHVSTENESLIINYVGEVVTHERARLTTNYVNASSTAAHPALLNESDLNNLRK